MDTSNTTGPIRRFVHDPSPAAAAGPYLPLGDGDEDDSRLNQLGYKQELRRSLSALSSFATTFNIVSVITGITTLYEMGLNFGGPVTMVYGWPVVGCMTLLVGLSMAEICSAYPTSGGLYFWSAKLCGNNWGPFAAWLTGWWYTSFSWGSVVHFMSCDDANPHPDSGLLLESSDVHINKLASLSFLL